MELSEIVFRYEIGTIINENRTIEVVTNDLPSAENYYEYLLLKHAHNKNVIIFLFDYDKNTNIHYYDGNV